MSIIFAKRSIFYQGSENAYVSSVKAHRVEKAQVIYIVKIKETIKADTSINIIKSQNRYLRLQQRIKQICGSDVWIILANLNELLPHLLSRQGHLSFLTCYGEV